VHERRKEACNPDEHLYAYDTALCAAQVATAFNDGISGRRIFFGRLAVLAARLDSHWR
jgi:hypothetical protein